MAAPKDANEFCTLFTSQPGSVTYNNEPAKLIAGGVFFVVCSLLGASNMSVTMAAGGFLIGLLAIVVGVGMRSEAQDAQATNASRQRNHVEALELAAAAMRMPAATCQRLATGMQANDSARDAVAAAVNSHLVLLRAFAADDSPACAQTLDASVECLSQIANLLQNPDAEQPSEQRTRLARLQTVSDGIKAAAVAAVRLGDVNDGALQPIAAQLAAAARAEASSPRVETLAAVSELLAAVDGLDSQADAVTYAKIKQAGADYAALVDRLNATDAGLDQAPARQIADTAAARLRRAVDRYGLLIGADPDLLAALSPEINRVTGQLAQAAELAAGLPNCNSEREVQRRLADVADALDGHAAATRMAAPTVTGDAVETGSETVSE